MSEQMIWKDGDVVRYKPHDNWCHHGIAVVRVRDGVASALDTYWTAGGDGSGSDSSWVDIEALEGLPVTCNIYEMEKPPYPYQFEDFAEADTLWIPMGGGHERKLVRRGAAPLPAQIEQRLAAAVETAERKRDAAENARVWAMKQLNEHIAKRGSVKGTPCP